jgi:hypothetical protein
MIDEKLKIIDRIKMGCTKAELSREYNIPESTLRGWVKDEDKLKKFVDKVDTDTGLSRKRTREAENSDLDKC